MSRERQAIDPEALTDYEQKIHTLREQGMSWREIGEAMGQKLESVRSRYVVIKEKLELQEARRNDRG